MGNKKSKANAKPEQEKKAKARPDSKTAKSHKTKRKTPSRTPPGSSGNRKPETKHPEHGGQSSSKMANKKEKNTPEKARDRMTTVLTSMANKGQEVYDDLFDMLTSQKDENEKPPYDYIADRGFKGSAVDTTRPSCRDMWESLNAKCLPLPRSFFPPIPPPVSCTHNVKPVNCCPLDHSAILHPPYQPVCPCMPPQQMPPEPPAMFLQTPMPPQYPWPPPPHPVFDCRLCPPPSFPPPPPQDTSQATTLPEPSKSKRRKPRPVCKKRKKRRREYEDDENSWKTWSHPSMRVPADIVVCDSETNYRLQKIPEPTKQRTGHMTSLRSEICPGKQVPSQLSECCPQKDVTACCCCRCRNATPEVITVCQLQAAARECCKAQETFENRNTEISEVNATVYRSIQVCLRSKKKNKNPKVKKFNFSMEAVKLFSSVLLSEHHQLYATETSPFSTKSELPKDFSPERFGISDINRDIIASPNNLMSGKSGPPRDCLMNDHDLDFIHGFTSLTSEMSGRAKGRHLKRLLPKFDNELNKLPSRKHSSNSSSGSDSDASTSNDFICQFDTHCPEAEKTSTNKLVLTCKGKGKNNRRRRRCCDGGKKGKKKRKCAVKKHPDVRNQDINSRHQIEDLPCRRITCKCDKHQFVCHGLCSEKKQCQKTPRRSINFICSDGKIFAGTKCSKKKCSCRPSECPARCQSNNSCQEKTDNDRCTSSCEESGVSTVAEIEDFQDSFQCFEQTQDSQAVSQTSPQLTQSELHICTRPVSDCSDMACDQDHRKNNCDCPDCCSCVDTGNCVRNDRRAASDAKGPVPRDCKSCSRIRSTLKQSQPAKHSQCDVCVTKCHEEAQHSCTEQKPSSDKCCSVPARCSSRLKIKSKGIPRGLTISLLQRQHNAAKHAGIWSVPVLPGAYQADQPCRNEDFIKICETEQDYLDQVRKLGRVCKLKQKLCGNPCEDECSEAIERCHQDRDHLPCDFHCCTQEAEKKKTCTDTPEPQCSDESGQCVQNKRKHHHTRDLYCLPANDGHENDRPCVLPRAKSCAPKTCCGKNDTEERRGSCELSDTEENDEAAYTPRLEDCFLCDGPCLWNPRKSRTEGKSSSTLDDHCQTELCHAEAGSGKSEHRLGSVPCIKPRKRSSHSIQSYCHNEKTTLAREEKCKNRYNPCDGVTKGQRKRKRKCRDKCKHLAHEDVCAQVSINEEACGKDVTKKKTPSCDSENEDMCRDGPCLWMPKRKQRRIDEDKQACPKTSSSGEMSREDGTMKDICCDGPCLWTPKRKEESRNEDKHASQEEVSVHVSSSEDACRKDGTRKRTQAYDSENEDMCCDSPCLWTPKRKERCRNEDKVISREEVRIQSSSSEETCRKDCRMKETPCSDSESSDTYCNGPCLWTPKRKRDNDVQRESSEDGHWSEMPRQSDDSVPDISSSGDKRAKDQEDYHGGETANVQYESHIPVHEDYNVLARDPHVICKDGRDSNGIRHSQKASHKKLTKHHHPPSNKYHRSEKRSQMHDSPNGSEKGKSRSAPRMYKYNGRMFHVSGGSPCRSRSKQQASRKERTCYRYHPKQQQKNRCCARKCSIGHLCRKMETRRQCKNTSLCIRRDSGHNSICTPMSQNSFKKALSQTWSRRSYSATRCYRNVRRCVSLSNSSKTNEEDEKDLSFLTSNSSSSLSHSSPSNGHHQILKNLPHPISTKPYCSLYEPKPEAVVHHSMSQTSLQKTGQTYGQYLSSKLCLNNLIDRSNSIFPGCGNYCPESLNNIRSLNKIKTNPLHPEAVKTELVSQRNSSSSSESLAIAKVKCNDSVCRDKKDIECPGSKNIMRSSVNKVGDRKPQPCVCDSVCGKCRPCTNSAKVCSRFSPCSFCHSKKSVGGSKRETSKTKCTSPCQSSASCQKSEKPCNHYRLVSSRSFCHSRKSAGGSKRETSKTKCTSSCQSSASCQKSEKPCNHYRLVSSRSFCHSRKSAGGSKRETSKTKCTSPCQSSASCQKPEKPCSHHRLVSPRSFCHSRKSAGVSKTERNESKCSSICQSSAPCQKPEKPCSHPKLVSSWSFCRSKRSAGGSKRELSRSKSSSTSQSCTAGQKAEKSRSHQRLAKPWAFCYNKKSSGGNKRDSKGARSSSISLSSSSCRKAEKTCSHQKRISPWSFCHSKKPSGGNKKENNGTKSISICQSRTSCQRAEKTCSHHRLVKSPGHSKIFSKANHSLSASGKSQSQKTRQIIVSRECNTSEDVTQSLEEDPYKDPQCTWLVPCSAGCHKNVSNSTTSCNDSKSSKHPKSARQPSPCVECAQTTSNTSSGGKEQNSRPTYVQASQASAKSFHPYLNQSKSSNKCNITCRCKECQSQNFHNNVPQLRHTSSYALYNSQANRAARCRDAVHCVTRVANCGRKSPCRANDTCVEPGRGCTQSLKQPCGCSKSYDVPKKKTRNDNCTYIYTKKVAPCPRKVPCAVVSGDTSSTTSGCRKAALLRSKADKSTECRGYTYSDTVKRDTKQCQTEQVKEGTVNQATDCMAFVECASTTRVIACQTSPEEHLSTKNCGTCPESAQTTDNQCSECCMICARKRKKRKRPCTGAVSVNINLDCDRTCRSRSDRGCRARKICICPQDVSSPRRKKSKSRRRSKHRSLSRQTRLSPGARGSSPRRKHRAKRTKIEGESLPSTRSSSRSRSSDTASKKSGTIKVKKEGKKNQGNESSKEPEQRAVGSLSVSWSRSSSPTTGTSVSRDRDSSRGSAGDASLSVRRKRKRSRKSTDDSKPVSRTLSSCKDTRLCVCEVSCLGRQSQSCVCKSTSKSCAQSGRGRCSCGRSCRTRRKRSRKCQCRKRRSKSSKSCGSCSKSGSGRSSSGTSSASKRRRARKRRRRNRMSRRSRSFGSYSNSDSNRSCSYVSHTGRREHSGDQRCRNRGSHRSRSHGSKSSFTSENCSSCDELSCSQKCPRRSSRHTYSRCEGRKQRSRCARSCSSASSLRSSSTGRRHRTPSSKQSYSSKRSRDRKQRQSSASSSRQARRPSSKGHRRKRFCWCRKHSSTSRSRPTGSCFCSRYIPRKSSRVYGKWKRMVPDIHHVISQIYTCTPKSKSDSTICTKSEDPCLQDKLLEQKDRLLELGKDIDNGIVKELCAQYQDFTHQLKNVHDRCLKPSDCPVTSTWGSTTQLAVTVPKKAETCRKWLLSSGNTHVCKNVGTCRECNPSKYNDMIELPLSRKSRRLYANSDNFMSTLCKTCPCKSKCNDRLTSCLSDVKYGTPYRKCCPEKAFSNKSHYAKLSGPTNYCTSLTRRPVAWSPNIPDPPPRHQRERTHDNLQTLPGKTTPRLLTPHDTAYIYSRNRNSQPEIVVTLNGNQSKFQSSEANTPEKENSIKEDEVDSKKPPQKKIRSRLKEQKNRGAQNLLKGAENPETEFKALDDKSDLTEVTPLESGMASQNDHVVASFDKLVNVIMRGDSTSVDPPADKNMI